MQVTPLSINNSYNNTSFEGLRVKKDALKTLGCKSKKALLNKAPSLKNLSEKANVVITRMKRDRSDSVQLTNVTPPVIGGVMATLLGALTVSSSPIAGGIFFAAGLGSAAYGFSRFALPSYNVKVKVKDYEKDGVKITESFDVYPEFPLEQSFKRIGFDMELFSKNRNKSKAQESNVIMEEINTVKNNTSDNYTKAKKRADLEEIKNSFVSAMKEGKTIQAVEIKAFEEAAKDFPDLVCDLNLNRQTYENNNNKKKFEKELLYRRINARLNEILKD